MALHYLIWLLITPGISILILYLWRRNELVKYKRTMMYILLYSFIVHVPWDIWAVKTGLWSFPEGKNIGIFLVSMPIEEYVYTLATPLLAIFVTIISYRHTHNVWS